MKIQNKLVAALLFCGFSAAALPADWQYTQTFDVTAPGLVKFSLPTDTLSAARPALEDLRVHDAGGSEQPFFIERPRPVGNAPQRAKSFQVSLQPKATVITLETGLTQPINAIILESPSENFIKAVRVESSTDDQSWKTIVEGQPIFRQPNGAGNLAITFPATGAKKLRLTVDDQRSQPVPVTSAWLHTAAAEPVPTEWQPASIIERVENPGETRLTVNLGAANLDLAAIKIETTEPLFTRAVSLAEPVIVEDGVREQNLGSGSIYRVAVEGAPAAENLSVRLDALAHSRELIISIRNQDSPPLAITGVSVERRPVYLGFAPRAAGTFRLLTGNSRCAAPRYDLAALGGNLKRVSATPITISPLADNPDFRAPEALAGVDLVGASLDVKDWKFRKEIKTTAAGAQRLELDLDVLAHAEGGFSDLRVMRGSNQVPFIIQRTSITRTLPVTATLAPDSKRPRVSRWVIKLPQAGLPLTRLSCESRTALFQRDMALYEEVLDERGEKFKRNISGESWTQTPERKGPKFSLGLNDRVQTDTMLLETENGDNPAIELDKFTVSYPATRLLFKAQPGETLFLYYGNNHVPPPNYDLALVAGQLLAADKSPAALAVEEQLKKSKWRDNQAVPGQGGVLLWAVLAVVVVGLLVVIAKLLPKSVDSTDKKT